MAAADGTARANEFQLISKDISYVTEEYVPARLEENEFLD
jgi:hypothetical protein